MRQLKLGHIRDESSTADDNDGVSGQQPDHLLVVQGMAGAPAPLAGGESAPAQNTIGTIGLSGYPALSAKAEQHPPKRSNPTEP
jgi:hypothetical protein